MFKNEDTLIQNLQCEAHCFYSSSDIDNQRRFNHMNSPKISSASPAENDGDQGEGESKGRPKVWDAETSITEAEIVTADKNGAIKSLRIEKVGEALHVFVKLTWRKEELCLTTSRAAGEGKPRAFKDLTRLVEYIQKKLLSVTRFEVEIKNFVGRD